MRRTGVNVRELLRLAMESWTRGMPRSHRLLAHGSLALIGASIGALASLASRQGSAGLPVLAGLVAIGSFMVLNVVLSLNMGRLLEMRQEHDAARQIQERLRPQRLPGPEGFDVAAICRSSREVGGDYYDVVPLDRHRLLLVVADVAGKGLPASILMANFQAIIHSIVSRDLALPEAARVIHDHIFRHTMPSRYVTAFLGALDTRDGGMRYVNAGHVPALILAADGGTRRLEPTAQPLGLLPESRFEQAETRVGRGAMLLLYTDGLTERSGARGDAYGDERVIAALRSDGGRSSAGLLDGLVRDSEAFAAGAPLEDDLTLLLVREVRGSTAP